MGRGHTGHNLGSHEGFTQYVPSHMRSFLFGYHISFCYFFALEVMRCHDFWTGLKMCSGRFDLLPFILKNGTVSDEMRSLMPMVMKFGQSDCGTWHKQFCHMQHSQVILAKS